jgi:hypothetical protein
MKNSVKGKTTLVEQAKLIKAGKDHKIFISEEEMEVALAWAREELTLNQVMEVLVLNNPSSVFRFLSKCFKSYVYLQKK